MRLADMLFPRRIIHVQPCSMMMMMGSLSLVVRHVPGYWTSPVAKEYLAQHGISPEAHSPQLSPTVNNMMQQQIDGFLCQQKCIMVAQVLLL